MLLLVIKSWIIISLHIVHYVSIIRSIWMQTIMCVHVLCFYSENVNIHKRTRCLILSLLVTLSHKHMAMPSIERTTYIRKFHMPISFSVNSSSRWIIHRAFEWNYIFSTNNLRRNIQNEPHNAYHLTDYTFVAHCISVCIRWNIQVTFEVKCHRNNVISEWPCSQRK